MSTHKQTPAAATAPAATAPAATAPARPSFFEALGGGANVTPAGAFPRIKPPSADTDPAVFRAQIRTAVAVVRAQIAAKRPELSADDLTDATLSETAKRMNAAAVRPWGRYVAKVYGANSKHQGKPFWCRETMRALYAECSAE